MLIGSYYVEFTNSDDLMNLLSELTWYNDRIYQIVKNEQQQRLSFITDCCGIDLLTMRDRIIVYFGISKLDDIVIGSCLDGKSYVLIKSIYDIYHVNKVSFDEMVYQTALNSDKMHFPMGCDGYASYIISLNKYAGFYNSDYASINSDMTVTLPHKITYQTFSYDNNSDTPHSHNEHKNEHKPEQNQVYCIVPAKYAHVYKGDKSVIKVGKHGGLYLDRLKTYGKGTDILRVCAVYNYNEMEKRIIAAFKKMYNVYAGREYFLCARDEAIALFDNVVHNYNSAV